MADRAARARLRARRRGARRAPRGRQADRPPPPRRRRARHPANAERLRDEGIDGRDAAVPAPTWSRAPPPTSPRTRPTVPRRSTSSTPPAAWPSGRTRSGTSTTPAEALDADRPLRGARASTASRPSTSPTREEQTRLLHEAAAPRAGCSPPARRTSTAPTTRASTVPRVRAVRPGPDSGRSELMPA